MLSETQQIRLNRIILIVLALALILAVTAAMLLRPAPDEPLATNTASPTRPATVPVTIKPTGRVTATSVASMTPAATATATPLPSATPTLPLPVFANPPDANFAQAAATWGGQVDYLQETNTGVWQYALDSFIHPIALDIHENKAYLIDGGRVLAFALDQIAPPSILLQPGDLVETAVVQEPLDLAVAPDGLLLLDRAGDVYKLNWQTGFWSLDRYGRSDPATSSHYFVAIATGNENNHFLLETNYKFTLNYTGEQQLGLWSLPDERAVDVSQHNNNVYVLTQQNSDATGSLRLYRNTRWIQSFRPAASLIQQPRQVVATETAVFVLDQAGRRLLILDPVNGHLIQLLQLPQTDPIGAFWSDGISFMFAGRDHFYFYKNRQRLAAIVAGQALPPDQPHDIPSWLAMDKFILPVGPNISSRDLQLPGAPRHYRLGVHGGLDLYWQAGTTIKATAAGVVIRASHNYTAPSGSQFAAWQEESLRQGYTSEEALDAYRGIQVWIDHGGGIISLYAHLAAIDPAVVVGTAVTQGQVLGTVGNSGSPASLSGEAEGAHVHFELRRGDYYLGQFLRPIEVRDLLQQLFE